MLAIVIVCKHVTNQNQTHNESEVFLAYLCYIDQLLSWIFLKICFYYFKIVYTSEVGIRSLGTGVTSGYEPTAVGARDQTPQQALSYFSGSCSLGSECKTCSLYMPWNTYKGTLLIFKTTACYELQCFYWTKLMILKKHNGILKTPYTHSSACVRLVTSGGFRILKITVGITGLSCASK